MSINLYLLCAITYVSFICILQDFNEQCPYSLSPVSIKSQKLLRSPRKATRKISRIPFKVLDAPELQDDFYLNLVDWSAQNVLAVGLGSCVYLWSACTSQVSLHAQYCVRRITFVARLLFLENTKKKQNIVHKEDLCVYPELNICFIFLIGDSFM